MSKRGGRRLIFLRKKKENRGWGNEEKFAGFSAECKSTAVYILHVFPYLPDTCQIIFQQQNI